MNIVIRTIPHKDHRYETVGDYSEDADGRMEIRVSDMGNFKYEFLVAIHELVEAVLCKDRGITDEVITAFDVEFENFRAEGDLSEPGDHPSAPYAKEHCIGTAVERLMCAELGVKWDDYEKAVQGLSP